MTANQIAYQTHLENVRANKAKEREINRSNLAQEALTKARDYSKEPIYYTLYDVASTGDAKGSTSGTVAKPLSTGSGSNNTMFRGLKSIFTKAGNKYATNLYERNKIRDATKGILQN